MADENPENTNNPKPPQPPEVKVPSDEAREGSSDAPSSVLEEEKIAIAVEKVLAARDKKRKEESRLAKALKGAKELTQNDCSNVNLSLFLVVIPVALGLFLARGIPGIGGSASDTLAVLPFLAAAVGALALWQLQPRTGFMLAFAAMNTVLVASGLLTLWGAGIVALVLAVGIGACFALLQIRSLKEWRNINNTQKARIAELEAELAKLQKFHEETCEVKGKREKTIAEQKGQIKEQKGQIKALKGEKSDLSKQLKEAKARIAELTPDEAGDEDNAGQNAAKPAAAEQPAADNNEDEEEENQD